jgi:hypothetical protein
MTVNRSEISSWLVSCSVSHAFFSQSFKLTFVPDQKDSFFLQNTCEEVVSG